MLALALTFTYHVDSTTDEDPYLYMVNDTFHLLFHVYETGEPGSTCANSTVSAHLFSLDGYEWHTTSTQPYGTTVPLSDGTNFTVATRERPKFFFDHATGQPTHLINGVSALSNCWDTKLGHSGQNSDLETVEPYVNGRSEHVLTQTPSFPEPPTGWQRFLGHCMSEKHCTNGCNCASHAYIRNFSKCQGSYPASCFHEANVACSDDEECDSFAISRYEGGSFETYSRLLNDSAVPNADWTAYARRCNLPPPQCQPTEPPQPPRCGAREAMIASMLHSSSLRLSMCVSDSLVVIADVVWRKPGDCVQEACVNCKFHGTTFTLVAPLAI